MFHYRTYIACFVLGLLVTLGVTPLIIRFSKRLRIMDRPMHRKMHRRATPLLGGVAVFIGMWLPLLLLSSYDNLVAQRIREQGGHLLLIGVAGLAMLIMGIIDDVRGLNATWKFAGQIPVAIGIVMAGVKFDRVGLPFLPPIELGTLAPIVSVIWLVGVTNALNLIDGIDGLAAGVTLIVGATLAALAVESGAALLTVVMCSLTGACLGFLRYNFSPAKIFLGDSGSLFLGMTLAASTTVENVKGHLGTSLLLPMVLLGYPIVDLALAVLRRGLRGRSLFAGDASHIHHRLLNKGFEHRDVCILVYATCLGFCFWTLAIAKTSLAGITIGTVGFCVLLIVGLYYLGYLKGFISPEAAAERNRFQVVRYFTAMTKARLRLAPSVADMIKTLEPVPAELNLAAIEMCFPTEAQGENTRWKTYWLGGSSAKDLSKELFEERFEFEDTGLIMRGFYEPDDHRDELEVEKRALFETVCQVVNEQLLRLPLPEPDRDSNRIQAAEVFNQRAAGEPLKSSD